MEIGNQHNFSMNPLTSVPPSQVSTRIASSNRSSQSENGDESQQNKVDQQAVLENARVIQQLVSRDREVRAHEAAHAAVGGQYVTGGPSFTYQRGPDGRSYAIGGEVHIDTAAVPNDPEATLAKADRVRRAALAPAQPSSQDLRVASRAIQTAVQARVEIAILRAEEAEQVLQEEKEAVEQVADEAGVQEVNSATRVDEAEREGVVASESETATFNLTAIQSFELEETTPVSVSLFA